MTNWIHERFFNGIVCCCLALASTAAFAQDADPPVRVARVAYTEGAVSFQPAGTQDWVEAPLNRPLTTGDTVWLDQGSRTELELDGSMLRLAGGTELSFVNLGDEVTQVQLASGSLLLRVRRLDDGETYEVDTPNLAFSVLRPGLYRISVDASGTSTVVIVRSGQGEVTGNGAAYTMRTGDADVYSGTDSVSAAALPASEPDDFEDWSQQRDRRWDRFVSAQYVSTDVVGYEDLDDYGSWSSTPEYGNVWYPTDVEQGWAPYRTGYWAYIAPWGYTWVDLKPWGFAPFHYGRWVWTGRAWGWIPCPPRADRGPYIRPVYAPALVAWVGVSAGVAWFALGPREVYVPSYHVSAEYVRNINVSNTTVNRTVIDNVYNTTIVNNRTVNVTYVNRGAPGAVTATSTKAFAGAQPVQSNRIAYDPAARRGEPVRVLAPDVVPAKQSVLGAARASAAPPANLQSRSIVARTAPPPPPLSVDQRLEALRGNGGKPLSPPQLAQIRRSAQPARIVPIRVAPPVAPAVAPVAHTSAPRDERTPRSSMPVSRPAPAAVHVNELPAPPRPASPSAAETALEREHLQQQQQLQSRQDQERLRMQQQQELEHQQAAQQQAAQARAQEIERQQQQQRAQEQAAQREQQQALAREQAARQQADQARAQELERQHQLQTQLLQQQHIEQQQQLEARQREQIEQQSQRRPVPPKPPEPKNSQ